MGDLFWNKVAGVLIGGVLVVMVIYEFGHIIVPSHGAEELTAENTSYPVDWASLGTVSSGPAEPEDTGPVDYGLLLAAADISAGERVVRRCAACHSFEEGGGNGVGPAMWDVVGRAKNAVAGFGYSGALGDGDWNYESLYLFLERPSAYAPGTSMSFQGLRNQDDRINLIAYLRTLSNNPVPLPDPLPAVEDAVEEVMDEAVEEIVDVPMDAPAEDNGGEDIAEDGGEL